MCIVFVLSFMGFTVSNEFTFMECDLRHVFDTSENEIVSMCDCSRDEDVKPIPIHVLSAVIRTNDVLTFSRLFG